MVLESTPLVLLEEVRIAFSRRVAFDHRDFSTHFLMEIFCSLGAVLDDFKICSIIGGSKSDKKMGVVALVMIDLRRRGKVQHFLTYSSFLQISSIPLSRSKKLASLVLTAQSLLPYEST